MSLGDIGLWEFARQIDSLGAQIRRQTDSLSQIAGLGLLLNPLPLHSPFLLTAMSYQIDLTGDYPVDLTAPQRTQNQRSQNFVPTLPAARHRPPAAPQRLSSTSTTSHRSTSARPAPGNSTCPHSHFSASAQSSSSRNHSRSAPQSSSRATATNSQNPAAPSRATQQPQRLVRQSGQAHVSSRTQGLNSTDNRASASSGASSHGSAWSWGPGRRSSALQPTPASSIKNERRSREPTTESPAMPVVTRKRAAEEAEARSRAVKRPRREEDADPFGDFVEIDKFDEDNKKAEGPSDAKQDLNNLDVIDLVDTEVAPIPKPRNMVKLSTLQCAICMDDMSNLTITHCGHIFCGECLHGALSINDKRVCPICRQKIELRPNGGTKSTPKNSFFSLQLKLMTANRKGKRREVRAEASGSARR